MKFILLIFLSTIVLSVANVYAQGKRGCGTSDNPCIGVSGISPYDYYEAPDLMITGVTANFMTVPSSSFPERLVFEMKIKNVGNFTSTIGYVSGLNRVIILLRLVKLSGTTQQWPYDIEVLEEDATTCSTGLNQLDVDDSSAPGTLWTIAPGEELEYNFFCYADASLIEPYRLIAAVLKVDSPMADLPTHNNIMIVPITGL